MHGGRCEGAARSAARTAAVPHNKARRCQRVARGAPGWRRVATHLSNLPPAAAGRTAAALAMPSERSNSGCAADTPRVTQPRRDRGAVVAAGAAGAAAPAKRLRLHMARAGGDAEGVAPAGSASQRNATSPLPTRTAVHCAAQAEPQRMTRRSPHGWLASRAYPGRWGAHPATHTAPRERHVWGLQTRVSLPRRRRCAR